jgi:hypothetical protein
MRQFLGLLLILGLLWVGQKILNYYKTIEAKAGRAAAEQATAPNPANPASLPGMPPALEAPLQVVMQEGHKSLRRWLDYYRPSLADPRLAWIELDYVTLVSAADPEMARQVFQAVKARTPTNSPVYPRLRQLQKTYE